MPPVDRVLKQMEAMLERIAAKGVDVTAERREWANLQRRRAQAADKPADNPEAGEAEYLEARMAKRRLFLRDPDLAAAQRILFVARHPYEPSHNYSDILDAQWRPGGGICVLEIPRREGRLDPAAGKVTTLVRCRRRCGARPDGELRCRADLLRLPRLAGRILPHPRGQRRRERVATAYGRTLP